MGIVFGVSLCYKYAMGKNLRKVKDMKSEQLKSDQLKMIGTINKILREIDYVKIDCAGVDNNLPNQNNFEGILGTKVYFLGHDMVIESDEGVLKRTEIELRKRSNEKDQEDQKLCHIYQTTSWDRHFSRCSNALRDLLITVVTPSCLDQEKNVQKTAIKTKNGLLNINCTHQESPVRFIKYLYYVINDSIRDLAAKIDDYGDDTNKILDFMTKGK